VSTQQLAFGISEIDSTARALRDQANILEGLVGRFKIDGQAEPKDSVAAGAAR
jgi:hypothetical protein